MNNRGKTIQHELSIINNRGITIQHEQHMYNYPT